MQRLLSSQKVNKLKLTNSFWELIRAFFRLGGDLSPEKENAKSVISRFEREFAKSFGTPHAIIFPHARVALKYILDAYGFEKGSEILMTPLTIGDIVNSIHLAGHRPRFVDIEYDSLNFDLEEMEKAITPKSKAILITYIGGVVPNLDRILEIAKKFNLKVIEDASQAVFSSYRNRWIGTWGDVAFFSLTNFKVISSLFGGMILTADSKLTSQLRDCYASEMLPPTRGILVRHCFKNIVYSVLFSRWFFSYFTYFLVLMLEYLAPQLTYRLYSGNIKVILGDFKNRLLDTFPKSYLCRFTAAQAELGLASLSRASRVASVRTQNGERLRTHLNPSVKLTVPSLVDGALNAYWRFSILTPYADGLKKRLLLAGIDTAKTFFTLCSETPGFELYHSHTPQAAQYKREALILEIDESISPSGIDYLSKTMNRFFEEKNRDGALEPQPS